MNDVKTVAKTVLLCDMLKEPCYQQLRTKEQLGPSSLSAFLRLEIYTSIAIHVYIVFFIIIIMIGYIVWSGTRSMSNLHGMRITVQSNVKDPVSVDIRIDTFLRDFHVRPEEYSLLLNRFL